MIIQRVCQQNSGTDRLGAHKSCANLMRRATSGREKAPWLGALVGACYVLIPYEILLQILNLLAHLLDQQLEFHRCLRHFGDD